MASLQKSSFSLSTLAQFYEFGPFRMDVREFLAYVYAVAGHDQQAGQLLKQLSEISAGKQVSLFLFAIIHAARGEKDLAFLYLDQAVEERSNWLIYLNVDPARDPLRSDPRFEALRIRMNLPTLNSGGRAPTLSKKLTRVSQNEQQMNSAGDVSLVSSSPHWTSQKAADSVSGGRTDASRMD